jgi:hypothetical protein
LISGVAFRVLVNASMPGLPLLANIATLRDVPVYSEFLLAFAAVILLGTIFHRIIVFSTGDWRHFIAGVILCLGLTLLPNRLPYLPLVSQWIGGQGFIAYPVVQYLPLFLLGIFRARHLDQFNPRMYFGMTIAGVFLYTLLIFFEIPLLRFPPSAGWIVCSAGIFFLYYGLAHLVYIKFPHFMQKYLNAVGQNVLAYLLLSNVVLFACYPLGLTKSLNAAQTFIFFVLLMGFIFFLQFIIVDLKRTNQSMNQDSRQE